VQVDQP